MACRDEAHPREAIYPSIDSTIETNAVSTNEINSKTQPEPEVTQEQLSNRFERLVNSVVESNPPEVVIGSLRTLTSILSNIVMFPKDSKYRVIKLSNKAINAKIVNANGSLDVLHSVGFVKEDEEVLRLPMSARIMEYSEFIMILNKVTMQLEMQIQSSKEIVNEVSTTAAATYFDPFKPSIFRAAIQPRGGRSETEAKLSAILEKQRSIEGEIPLDLESFRSTQVLYLLVDETTFELYRYFSLSLVSQLQ